MTPEEAQKLSDLATQETKPELEYRLYYDNTGKVISYSTSNMPGNFIKITKEQFVKASTNVSVVDGKLVTTEKSLTIYRLTKNIDEGTKASKYDINILTEENFIYWKHLPHDVK